MPPAYFSRRLTMPEIDEPAELSAHGNVAQLIDDVEHQLQQMPALIEAKLKDQLALLNGLDLIGEVERHEAHGDGGRPRRLRAGRGRARKDAAAAFTADAR